MAALSVDGTPMPALPNSADQINYDNTTSGLSATTVKGAVDELASEKQDATDNNLTTTNKTIVGGINELKSGLTDVENTVDKIATSGNIWYPAVFTTTPVGDRYFAPLNSLPAHETATLVEVNELGTGALTLADFTLVANDEHNLSYISTTNSDYAGKVYGAKITFA